MMQAVLLDSSILGQSYGPRMQKTCYDWMHRSLSSSLICGISGISGGTIEANSTTTSQAQISSNTTTTTTTAGQAQISTTTTCQAQANARTTNQVQVSGTVAMAMAQIQVKDSVAPPLTRVKSSSYRVAPSSLTYKLRSARRRSRGRGHNNNGDGDENSGDGRDDDNDDDGGNGDGDEGGFGGSNNNGHGGNNNNNNKDKFWGSSSSNNWNYGHGSDSEWWQSAGDAALAFVYQVACWISLMQCLFFVLRKLLDGHRGADSVLTSSMAVGNCYLPCSSATS